MTDAVRVVAPAPPAQAADEPLLTVEDVAKRLGVSDKTIRRWIHDKHLACVLLGPAMRIRIKPSELDRVLQAK